MAGTAKAAEKAQETAQEAAEKRVYKLTSENKFLTVSALGVQFMKGSYETTDPATAKALLTIEGVDLVE